VFSGSPADEGWHEDLRFSFGPEYRHDALFTKPLLPQFDGLDVQKVKRCTLCLLTPPAPRQWAGRKRRAPLTL